VFSEIQQAINSGWKQSRKSMDPVHQRKHFFCPKCAKQRFRVKMEYQGNHHETYQMCRYNFDVYKCPRCGHVYKDWSRIEGRGKTGTNLGKLYGSK